MTRAGFYPAMRSWAPRVVLTLSAAFTASCSSDSGDDGDQTGGASASAGGGLSFGGFSALGGSIGAGGSGGADGKGGAPGKGGASGGATSGVGGSAGASGSAAMIPPPAGPGGKSPYLPECHGDTRTCGDVVNLTCLGIKDPAVRGFSCSSSCQVDSDCSMAPSGSAARTGCVDFAVAKHCLFICLERGEMSGCPTGMSCYVYTGSPVGYCLWPP